MAYYENRNFNNGYGRRSDRGNYNRGYDDNRGGNYDDRDRRPMDCPFSINQPVKHIATGVKLSVIRIGREQIECRKPDLSSEWFYEYELEPIAEGK